jgi:hypothetical protein
LPYCGYEGYPAFTVNGTYWGNLNSEEGSFLVIFSDNLYDRKEIYRIDAPRGNKNDTHGSCVRCVAEESKLQEK